jgi:hypothetical protein
VATAARRRRRPPGARVLAIGRCVPRLGCGAMSACAGVRRGESERSERIAQRAVGE